MMFLSFETAVKQALEKNQPVDINREDFSLNTRAKENNQFVAIARLEGLEPPTL